MTAGEEQHHDHYKGRIAEQIGRDERTGEQHAQA
jgi:hypothetical protein